MAERENLISAYPLEWPAGFERAKRRQESRFNKRTLPQVREEILNELRLFGAKKVIISTNQETRIDGKFVSQRRRMDDPGAAVYFEKGGVSLVMANDSYFDLEDNLHALASSIEALRRIERYGSSDLLERAFRGFKALPETAGGFKWWEVLGVTMNATEEQVQEAFRVKAKLAHPDAGGSSDEFNKLINARDQALAGIRK